MRKSKKKQKLLRRLGNGTTNTVNHLEKLCTVDSLKRDDQHGHYNSLTEINKT